MTALFSKSREILAAHWPLVVAAAMVAYVVTLFFLVRADVERVADLLGRG